MSNVIYIPRTIHKKSMNKHNAYIHIYYFKSNKTYHNIIRTESCAYLTFQDISPYTLIYIYIYLTHVYYVNIINIHTQYTEIILILLTILCPQKVRCSL